MKILVDELPKDKQNCPFYHQDTDGWGGLCTLSGKNEIHCWKDSDDECEMCITFSRCLKGETK